MLCERKTPDKRARDQSRQPTSLLLRRAEGMDRLNCERTLDRRQRAQTGVGPLKLLHNEAVRGVAKASTTVLFQIRRVKAQRTHAWNEIVWEFGRAMARNDLGQNFLLYKTPRPIARCAFLLCEKLFDAVIIQRSCCHVGMGRGLRVSLAGGDAKTILSRALPPQQFETRGADKKGAWRKRLYNYFAVGNPMAFQALKPPAMERTFL